MFRSQSSPCSVAGRVTGRSSVTQPGKAAPGSAQAVQAIRRYRLEPACTVIPGPARAGPPRGITDLRTLVAGGRPAQAAQPRLAVLLTFRNRSGSGADGK